MNRKPTQRATVQIEQFRAGKKLLVAALGTALLIQPITLVLPVSSTYAATAAVTQQLVKQSEEMITSGAKLIHYQWTKSDGDTSNVHVIEVDLTNPYVQLNVMNGKQGTVTGTASVGSMVKNSGAVAGVNADFFNTTNGKGNPIGAEVISGTLVSSTSKLSGMYAFAITADRKPIVDLFTFDGLVTAADGSTFPLAGLNKGAYTTEPDNGYSHANAMYIYTSAWTASRPDAKDSSTTPTEVLVVDGVVQQIAENSMIAGVPPVNGYILRTHGKAAQFVREHLQVGQPVTADYSLIAQSTNQKVDPSSLQMLVGGHTLLVDQGKASAFTRDTSGISGAYERSRTAVGYSQDNSKAYLITVEDVGSSDGMTLKELQQAMVKIGVWKGVNLDGGGSTTMIARPLGETETTLAHPTENSSQRAVANGIGVFTTAPAGQLRGLKASGSTVLFIGQQASYSLKGYDTYYNPIDTAQVAATWKDATGLGTFSGSTYTAAKAGKTTFTAVSGSVKDQLSVEIIGSDQIAQLSVEASSPVLEAGKTFAVPVTATLLDGRKFTLPAQSVKWELSGFTGAVKDGKLTISAIGAGKTEGYAIARYDGFSAPLVLTAGTNKKFIDFDSSTYSISYSGTNAVTGSAGLVTGLEGSSTGQALQLNYDFSKVTSGTKAAYAVMNGTGVAIEGKPSTMTVDVYGDGSVNWVRAEFTDAAGKAYPVTLADKVTWNGWKQLKADVPSNVTYPLKLKRLYVASLEEGQDERALTGQLSFDNLTLQYPATVTSPTKSKIVLTLGSQAATVGGQAMKLDAAPVALNGTTYLPLRFVTDAMGATIGWDQTAKRVSVLRGGHLLEMWIGQKSFLLDGKRLSSEIAPISRNGRTMVPIRLVSEQLGLTVGWNAKAKTITVE
ncbi:exopolysaccharide biosynthesis protein [Paenibacillus phyllosphaerae]|uniref:Exopolysaccharide biosynthesis protein n=1 Tax=Paenibacillus phyllosphaerae TaxID=274593 RepID=A0A7W5AXB4_9BACL|nr:stalk domain-containing protein [Paenibacillus phyllosphaerae]MBB3110510.1 exopolysaccharide biosynthesis protein [Paenibacillus phyllosphaerae]